jgi:hypothetical protein
MKRKSMAGATAQSIAFEWLMIAKHIRTLKTAQEQRINQSIRFRIQKNPESRFIH